MNCYIKIEFHCETVTGQRVFLVGGIEQLGKWDAKKGIELFTDSTIYPIWITKIPLMLKLGTIFQFKFIKQLHDHTEWEEYSNNMNRSFRIRHRSILMKGKWNDYNDRHVIIDQSSFLSNKSNDSCKSIQKIKKVEISLDSYTKKKDEKDFNPFENSDSSDYDSDMSVEICKNDQEEVKRFKKVLILEGDDYEVESPTKKLKNSLKKEESNQNLQ